MTRRETKNAADARLGFGKQQSFLFVLIDGRLWPQGCEVIIKNKSACVCGITCAVRSLIAGTKITIRIVGNQPLWRYLFDLTLPGPRGAMGRYEHPFPRQRVVTAVRCCL